MKLRGKDPDFISVVLFLREPRVPSQEMLEQAIERAWPTNEEQEDSDKFVVINGPVILVKAQGSLFTIASGSRPYIQDPEVFAKRIKDLQVREAVLQHKSWISVDNLAGSRPNLADTDTQYAQAAKLSAELVNEDCLGICLPGEQVIVGSSLNMVEGLRNFRSVREFSQLYRPDSVLDSSRL